MERIIRLYNVLKMWITAQKLLVDLSGWVTKPERDLKEEWTDLYIKQKIQASMIDLETPPNTWPRIQKHVENTLKPACTKRAEAYHAFCHKWS